MQTKSSNPVNQTSDLSGCFQWGFVVLFSGILLIIIRVLVFSLPKRGMHRKFGEILCIIVRFRCRVLNTGPIQLWQSPKITHNLHQKLP